MEVRVSSGGSWRVDRILSLRSEVVVGEGARGVRERLLHIIIIGKTPSYFVTRSSSRKSNMHFFCVGDRISGEDVETDEEYGDRRRREEHSRG